MKHERGKMVLGALGLLAGLLLIGCALVLGDRLPGRVKIGSRVRYQEEAIAAIVERGLCQ